LISRQLQVGGFYYPNKPINDCGRPSEGYPYLIQALTQGGSITKSYGTGVRRDMYNAVIPSLPANSDTACVVPANGSRPQISGTDDALTSRIFNSLMLHTMVMILKNHLVFYFRVLTVDRHLRF